VNATFDIFFIDDSDQPVWQDALLTLDDALARVQQLGATYPGEYFIRSQKTSVEVSMRVNRGVRYGLLLGPLTVRHRPCQMS
jgi:hypothetical protein